MLVLFLIMILLPPIPTLFPYTTLFRSYAAGDRHGHRFNLDRRGGESEVEGEHLADQHPDRSEEHTSELQSPYDLVCRLLLEKKKTSCIVISGIGELKESNTFSN